MCVCVCCMCVLCVCRGGQKRVSSTLELKFQDVVNHLTWVLETKLVSSWRTTSSLDCWAISPAPTRTISWFDWLQSPLMTSLMVGFERSSAVKLIPAMVSLQCHYLLLSPITQLSESQWNCHSRAECSAIDEIYWNLKHVQMVSVNINIPVLLQDDASPQVVHFSKIEVRVLQDSPL